MEAVECRYRDRVIGVLYQGHDGQLAYRKYHRPSKDGYGSCAMNDPNPFRTLVGSINHNPWAGFAPSGDWRFG